MASALDQFRRGLPRRRVSSAAPKLCSPRTRTVFLAQAARACPPRGSVSGFIIEVSGEMGFTWQWFGGGTELFQQAEDSRVAQRGAFGCWWGAAPGCPIGAERLAPPPLLGLPV